MKIVFFGTPEYALFPLKAIGESTVAVVTQKPQPVGRKQFLTYSPVDTWAHKRKIPVFYSAQEFLKEDIKADLGVLVAYGEILEKEILSYFPHKILNIHPSLLPKWRGASPVQGTIVAGETLSGATIITLDEKIDHGPIISQFKEEVREDDTTGTLRTRLFERSAEVLKTLIPAYIQGKITPRKQDEKEATFTIRIKKEDGFIPPKYLAGKFDDKWALPFIKDYSLVPSAYSLDYFIRAMDPWPGAWTLLRLGSSGQSKRLKIVKAHIENDELVLDEVQLEGKNPVSWKEFKQGYPKATFA